MAENSSRAEIERNLVRDFAENSQIIPASVSAPPAPHGRLGVASAVVLAAVVEIITVVETLLSSALSVTFVPAVQTGMNCAPCGDEVTEQESAIEPL
jgi:hypothetical protein